MSTIDKISEKLTEKGKTQKELTDFLGLKKSAFSGWKSGKTKSYLKYIKEIAVFLETSVDDLLSEEDNKNRPIEVEEIIKQMSDRIFPEEERTQFINSLFEVFTECISIPLVGTVACGTPILAEQNIEQYVLLPDAVQADFALRCKGDSMINAGINDGDIVFIRSQKMVENGQIAVVQITDFETEATLKKVYISNNSITLVPQNTNYEPITITGSDMANVEIIGKCVAVLKDFEK